MFFFISSCHGDSQCVTLKSFSHSNESVFPMASPPDEALPVFALLLAAGAAASRRRAGRAGRHCPVCWSELATRQVHEADPRPAQQAAALGTRPAGAHHEPPRAPAGHQPAAPGLVATRRSHRPAAHTRGARPDQERLVPPPRPLKTIKTSPAAAHRSAARSSWIPSPATGSWTWWTSGRPSDAGTCGGAYARSSVCAPECSTASTRTFPTAGSGARHKQRRAAGEAC